MAKKIKINPENDVFGNSLKSIPSIPVKVSISNESNNGKLSLYGRLRKYRKDKGISEQDVIRFSLSTFLDRVGY